MNELVEKFARECGAWNQVYGNRTFMIDEHFDIEKFARLIVQEGASKVDNILREKKDGGGTMGDEIREHFGVES